MLGVMASLAHQIDLLDASCAGCAKRDERLPGAAVDLRDRTDPGLHLLAEIGDAKRFRRARQVVRAAGLDPVVTESGEKHRRGHLAKEGSPHLRWALVEAAQHAHRTGALITQLYRATRHAARTPRH